jgi:hypothetical protein
MLDAGNQVARKTTFVAGNRFLQIKKVTHDLFKIFHDILPSSYSASFLLHKNRRGTARGYPDSEH